MIIKSKIHSFKDLKVWQEGHVLVLLVYKIIIKFPKEGTYSLSDQIKRCAVFITSNIAEGFSRQSKKEKLQFYFMAKGSLTELQNQLLVARDVGYITKLKFQENAEQSVKVHQLLNGLIKSAKSKE